MRDVFIWISGIVFLLSAGIQSAVAQDAATTKSNTTTQSAATTQPAQSRVRLLLNGVPVEGLVQFGNDNASPMYFVGKDGLLIARPKNPTDVFRANSPVGSKDQRVFEGRGTLLPQRDSIDIPVRDTGKKYIKTVITANDSKGNPIANGEIWIRVVQKAFNNGYHCDKDGNLEVYLLPDTVFRVHHPYERSMNDFQSETFVPNALKDGKFVFNIPDHKSVVFTVSFVIRDNGVEQKCDSIVACEIRTNMWVWWNTIDGVLYLPVGTARAANAFSPFIIGETVQIGLGQQDSKKYTIADSGKITIGKAGQEAKVVLIPVRPVQKPANNAP